MRPTQKRATMKVVTTYKYNHFLAYKKNGGYRIDPIEDLIPLCPNCHAMIHRSAGPLDLTTLGDLMQNLYDSKT